MPSDIKFKSGTMKHILKKALAGVLPPAIVNRKDKMGFPVPLTEWMQGEAREFVREVFSSRQALTRGLINNQKVLENLDTEEKFGRKTWGLFCLELWHQEFHDQESEYKKLVAY